MNHREKPLMLVILLPLMVFLTTCGSSSTGLFSTQGSPGGGTDTTAPTVTTTTPSNNSSGVITNEITVTFSEAMSSSSIDNIAITLSGSEGNIPGIVSSDGNKATFTVIGSLASNATYNLKVDTSVEDLVGNQMLSSYSSSLTTGEIKVIEVSAGNRHVLALKNDGTVWAWGRNNVGQLGDGTTVDKLTPIKVQGLSGIISVSAGYEHSVALKSDGTVWTWGSSYGGALGDGTVADRRVRSKPGIVSGLAGIIKIAAGKGVATTVLKNDGSVWTWGGFSSISGFKTPQDPGIPGKVTGITNVVAVAHGNTHTLVLKSDGTIQSWGYDVFGECGSGDVILFPNENPKFKFPVQVVGLTGITAIAAGEMHSMAVKNDGTVWGWGYGDLTLGPTPTPNTSTPIQIIGMSGAISVSGGGIGGSSAIKNDNTLWSWGTNVGNGEIPSLGEYFNPTQVVVGGSIVSASCGTNYQVCVNNRGLVYSWGTNGFGQLGDGTTTDNLSPVQVKNMHVATGYQVSGAIRVNGVGVEGVKVSFSGAGKIDAYTDSNGNYQVGIVNGSYTISASKSGYSFTPASIPITVSGGPITTQDFVGAVVAPSYSITGKVTAGGLGLSGVTMTLSDSTSTFTSTTGGGGSYAFSNVLPGTYTITPNMTGYSFNPTNRSVVVTGSSVSVPDFVGIAGGVLSVISTDPANDATGVSTIKAGVSVDFSKDVNAATVTRSTFQISPAVEVLDPTRNGSNKSYVLLLSPLSTFAPNTLYTVTIKGTITDTAGNPLGQDYVFSFRTGP